MIQLRSELNMLGVRVNSRWLDESEMPLEGQEKYLREHAFMDIQDVVGCNIFVRFSDDLSIPLVPAELATGGRFVEMGIALREGIPIVVVGGHQVLFDYLPVTHLKNKDQLKRYLAPYEVN